MADDPQQPQAPPAPSPNPFLVPTGKAVVSQVPADDTATARSPNPFLVRLRDATPQEMADGPNPFLVPVTDGATDTSTTEAERDGGNFLTRAVAGIREAARERGGYLPLVADMAKQWFIDTKNAFKSFGMGAQSPAITANYGVIGGRPTATMTPEQFQAATALPPGEPITPEQDASVARGLANLATLGVGGALGEVPALAARTLGGGALIQAGTKAATYAGMEALGGATYGAIAPTAPGQTRGQAIGENAALFALTSTAGGLVGQTLRQASRIPGRLAALTARPVAEAGAEVAGTAAGAAAAGVEETLGGMPVSRIRADLGRSGYTPEQIETELARLREQFQPKKLVGAVERMPGTASELAPQGRGFNVEGTSPLPPQPTTPTVTEMVMGTAAPRAANQKLHPTDAQQALIVQAAEDAASELHPLQVADQSVKAATNDPPVIPTSGVARPDVLGDLSLPEPASAAPSNPALPRNATLARFAAALQGQSDDMIRRLAGLAPVARDVAAPIAKQAGLNVVATGLGAGALGLSEDTDLMPGDRALLRYVGAAFLLGGTSRYLGSRFAATGFGRQVLEAMNPLGRITNPTLRTAANEALAFHNLGSPTRAVVQDALNQVIPKDASPGALYAMARAIEKGDAAPEMAGLTTAQQEVFRSLHDLHDYMGRLGRQLGVLDQMHENYYSILFPQEETRMPLGQGQATVGPQMAGFTRARKFETLEDAYNWAQKSGHPLPITDPRLVIPAHIQAFFRTVATRQTIDQLQRLGGIVERESLGSAGDVLRQASGGVTLATPPAGDWRLIQGVPSLPNHVAPSAIASLVEHLAAPRTAPGVLGRMYDAASGQIMRLIMWNAAIHGANVLRGAASLDGGVAAYGQFYRMVEQADPVMLEAARAGVNLMGRSDLNQKMSEAMDRSIAQARGDAVATTSRLKQLGMQAAAWNDHILWNRAVPALGLMAWSQQMLKWAEQTGGRFLAGSPEYEAASREAAEFANRQMGLAPALVRSPQLQRALQRVFFAPNWLMSRMALTTNSYNQLADVAAGQVNPFHAAYLQQRLRMAAIGTALTWTGSMVLSGKEPGFNEHTNRYYMNTGLKDHSGHEIGIDLAGWWQDDLRSTNAPLQFLASKLNPILTLAGQTITGRDFAGRPMTGAERFDNILNATPIGATVNVARSIGDTGGAVKGAAHLSGIAGAASLPRPVDVFIGTAAQRLLVRQGLKADDDTVRELAMLIRANIVRGQPAISNDVVRFLALQRRAASRNGPVTALWLHSRQILDEWARSSATHLPAGVQRSLGLPVTGSVGLQ